MVYSQYNFAIELIYVLVCYIFYNLTLASMYLKNYMLNNRIDMPNVPF